MHKYLASITLLLSLGMVRPVGADFTYSLDAVDGMIAGSALSGSITLPNSLSGDDVWNLGEAVTFGFNLNFAGGLNFAPSGLTVANDVRFDVGVGAAILTPVLPDATAGFAPDWRVDTSSGGQDYFLGIGHDLARPLWNLAAPPQGGPAEMGDTLAGAPVAWRLVLIPEPAAAVLLACAALPLACARRRR